MHRALIASVLSPLVLLSCATVGGLRNEPLDRGVARRFPAPIDSVMGVVPAAVASAGLDLKESECYGDSVCVVIGTEGMKVGPSGHMGSMARVVVEAAGDATIIRVLSRRRMAHQVAAKEDYSLEILSQIEARLGVPHS